MAQTQTKKPIQRRLTGVNEFSINIGTENGSGSQTANLTILRAIFKMGIPVSGKNIFPSNIQGLPTWYKIRVSQSGYGGRRKEADIVVAMNPKTFTEDQDDLVQGGLFLYADDIKDPIDRVDMITVPMPIKDIVKEAKPHRDLRKLVANMVYVGVLANLLGIELEPIKAALEFHFKGKESPVEFNMMVINLAYQWAEENLDLDLPYWIEPRDLTDNSILVDGNTAAGLGTIYGGMHFVSWYPITPATSLPESIIEYAPKLRVDPETGKSTYAIIQAEDELAAVGMVVGAGWAGLRAMTATSGPGLSLMAEYTSLAYFAEIPIVIWVVQRVGPSTGLPTRTAQGDINLAYYLGQGDTEHIMLIPGSVKECFEFGWKALDLAEKYQTVVFCLSDLDLGKNQWMTEPFEYPETPIERGKILWEEDLEKIKDEWGRYRDLDGDFIPYRTVPGNTHPKSAYFARGTGHDDFANYSEHPEQWRKNLDRIKNKINSSKTDLPEPVIIKMRGATKGIIAFGSPDAAMVEALDYLKADGVKLDYLRLRSLPASDQVLDFIRSHEKVYVIENNRDGQMHSILSLELPEKAQDLVSLAMIDGLPLNAEWIREAVLNEENA
ncbi:MAG: 2-oxoacid:acceptor oxidoreductase subunit alpha [Chloroflexota bacterium]|nr:MAG: 2-oxoacid:acceptor oxidoreductase subunit alpha [Chloroflexota bacterium]